MPIPVPIHRFWIEMDGLFSIVRPTPWGAVITDGRYPRIWDANYARVDAGGVSLAEVQETLLPNLHVAGADTFHVLVFDAERNAGLLRELTDLGHRLSWDVVMAIDEGTRVQMHDVVVESVPAGAELWARVRDSFALFGVEPDEPVEQLRAIERDVLAPEGKRWFGVRDEAGVLVSLAALLPLGQVAYIDNVATFPQARRRGYASALTARIVEQARAKGIATIFLLADPDDAGVLSLYGRLGFREVGRLASTKGPILADQATNL